MTNRSSSIQSRLILLVLGSLLVVELVTAWTGLRRALHEANELLDAQLVQYAQIMLSLAHEGRDDEVRLPGIKVHPYQSKLMFQIWDMTSAPRLMLRSPEAPHRWPEGVKASGYSEVTLAGHAWRFYVAKRDNTGYVVLAARDLHRAVLGNRVEHRDGGRRDPGPGVVVRAVGARASGPARPGPSTTWSCCGRVSRACSRVGPSCARP